MTNFGIIMLKKKTNKQAIRLQTFCTQNRVFTFTNTNLQISPIFSCRAAGLRMDLTGNEHGGKLRSTTGFLISS